MTLGQLQEYSKVWSDQLKSPEKKEENVMTVDDLEMFNIAAGIKRRKKRQAS